jgi:hypothetical protein
MVEVFKTNIVDKTAASEVTAILYNHYPSGRINFDLEDCDKILRIESEKVIPEEVAGILSVKGYFCQVLE